MGRTIFIIFFSMCSFAMGIIGGMILPFLFSIGVALLFIPTTFVLFIKWVLHKRDPLSENEIMDRPLSARRVLIVDDDIDIASISANEFAKMGFEVAVATSHQSAVLKMNSEKYDVLLLDWLLNDGYLGGDVLKSLTHTDRLYKPVSVISFSSFDKNKIHIASSENFNYQDHWQKPMNPLELRARISYQFALSA